MMSINADAGGGPAIEPTSTQLLRAKVIALKSNLIFGLVGYTVPASRLVPGVNPIISSKFNLFSVLSPHCGRQAATVNPTPVTK